MMMRPVHWVVPAMLGLACTPVLPGTGEDARPATAPARAFAPAGEKRLAARNGIVAAAHPLASEAGAAMLRQGGNAVDAAVATAFALGVVEPMMSGIGGGGGMLIWLQQEQRAEYVDFYSATPAAAWRRPLPDTGTAALRDVAVPGAVAGLLEAHERYGRLPLGTVLQPAVRLAEDGFPMYLVLHEGIAANRAKLLRFPAAAERFLPDGEPPPIGTAFRQPELAATLRALARDGRRAFYDGQVAANVVAVINAGGNPIRVQEFAAYAPQWDKRPLCTDYRAHVVLSAPPPQTGMRVLHALNLLEMRQLAELGLPTRSASAFSVLASALRIAAADHARHNSDPNWAIVPARGVSAKGFARQRAMHVENGATADRIEPGDASGFDEARPSTACEPLQPYGAARRNLPSPAGPAAGETEDGETTHLSVVDRDGNAVALSNTLSPYFGAGAWVDGFFLNSSGYDFVANSPDAPAVSDWRVRTSTISPTIVLRDGAVRAVIGAPGGGRIPGAVIQGLVYMLDYGLDPFEAVAMPRMLASAASAEVEIEHGFSALLLGELRERGWRPVTPTPGYARLYAIGRVGDLWVGAADPRHDGAVRGH
jgi:gamma-glutamyltranspeptidase / glutathione hydrolase